MRCERESGNDLIFIMKTALKQALKELCDVMEKLSHCSVVGGIMTTANDNLIFIVKK